jgi:hypothetical protein
MPLQSELRDKLKCAFPEYEEDALFNMWVDARVIQQAVEDSVNKTQPHKVMVEARGYLKDRFLSRGRVPPSFISDLLVRWEVLDMHAVEDKRTFYDRVFAEFVSECIKNRIPRLVRCSILGISFSQYKRWSYRRKKIPKYLGLSAERALRDTQLDSAILKMAPLTKIGAML